MGWGRSQGRRRKTIVRDARVRPGAGTVQPGDGPSAGVAGPNRLTAHCILNLGQWLSWRLSKVHDSFLFLLPYTAFRSRNPASPRKEFLCYPREALLPSKSCDSSLLLFSPPTPGEGEPWGEGATVVSKKSGNVLEKGAGSAASGGRSPTNVAESCDDWSVHLSLGFG